MSSFRASWSAHAAHLEISVVDCVVGEPSFALLEIAFFPVSTDIALMMRY